jgi:hypothetical protein
VVAPITITSPAVAAPATPPVTTTACKQEKEEGEQAEDQEEEEGGQAEDQEEEEEGGQADDQEEEEGGQADDQEEELCMGGALFVSCSRIDHLIYGPKDGYTYKQGKVYLVSISISFSLSLSLFCSLLLSLSPPHSPPPSPSSLPPSPPHCLASLPHHSCLSDTLIHGRLVSLASYIHIHYTYHIHTQGEKGYGYSHAILTYYTPYNTLKERRVTDTTMKSMHRRRKKRLQRQTGCLHWHWIV